MLVVEDDALQRMLVADEMRRVGHKVIEAASADEAVTILQAGARVDLIITDIDMPGAMDGLALASLLRKNHAAIYVLIASGQVAGLRQAGTPANAIFSKPYDLPAIATTVRRLIGGQQTVQRGPSRRERQR